MSDQKVVIEVFACGACHAVKGMASTMFNTTIDGRRLILCRRDAASARTNGLKVFPLSATLARDARQAAAREASKDFWADFGRRKTEKALRRPAIRIT
ncbi:MAG: hypothetical protein HYW90_03060 [Candidatus Sungbacteria bacterium]|nr:hypothetical protein [Candidatus Sungbacteria bacterium]